MTDYERSFIKYFLAISYIRIIQFREELNYILEIDVENLRIHELRGTEYDIDVGNVRIMEKTCYKNSALFEQFDWETEFYSHIQFEEKYGENTAL